MANVSFVKITSFVPGNPFRANGIDLETSSKMDNIHLSPHKNGFTMPEIGSIVLCDRTKISERNIITTLWNPDNGRASGPNNLYDSYANQSNLLDMGRGDAYVGSRARAYLNDHVFLYSDTYRSRIFLNDSGLIDVKGYNWEISTEDRAVSMSTEASTNGFGDSLHLCRISEEHGGTKLDFNVNGDAILTVADAGQDKGCVVEYMASGDINMYAGGKDSSAPSSITLKGSGDQISAKSTEVRFDCQDFKVYGKSTLTGNVVISGKLSVTELVTTPGGISSSGPIVASGGLTASSPLTVTGPVMATGGMTIGGALNCMFAAVPGVLPAVGSPIMKVPILIGGAPFNMIVIA